MTIKSNVNVIIIVITTAVSMIRGAPNLHPYPKLCGPPSKQLPTCPQKCKTLGACSIPKINCLCYGKCKPDTSEVECPTHTRRRRNAVNVGDWPKHGDGLIYVPYEFDNQVIEAQLEDLMKRAEEEFAEHTCYRLVRSRGEENHVVIADRDGCFSHVGMTGGRQWISLSPPCQTLDTILHEFMHAIGFHHEMNRRDRDKHIRINKANILQKFEDQFDMTPLGTGFAYGKDYDIKSIMHYGNYEASQGQGETMSSIRFPSASLGPESGSSFSEGDKLMLNRKGLCGRDVPRMFSGAYSHHGQDML